MIEAVDVHKSFVAGGGDGRGPARGDVPGPRGSCTFIVGPSGSGKSTLLYLLGALDRPTSGTIRVEGQDLTAMTEAEQDAYRRDRVGFIYQSFNLISNLSAVDNVLLPYIPLRRHARAAGEGGGPAEAGRAGRPAEPPPAPALRRRAAARGDRPGPDQGPGPDPRRRADRQPRPGRRRGNHPAPARAVGRPWSSSPTTAASSPRTTSSWRSRTAGSCGGRGASPVVAEQAERPGRPRVRGPYPFERSPVMRTRTRNILICALAGFAHLVRRDRIAGLHRLPHQGRGWDGDHRPDDGLRGPRPLASIRIFPRGERWSSDAPGATGGDPLDLEIRLCRRRHGRPPGRPPRPRREPRRRPERDGALLRLALHARLHRLPGPGGRERSRRRPWPTWTSALGPGQLRDGGRGQGGRRRGARLGQADRAAQADPPAPRVRP